MPPNLAQGAGLFRFKCLGHRFEQLPNREMLRTDAFTLSTADAVRRFAALGRMYAVIVETAPVLIFFSGIHAGKQIGDGNMPGTSGGAVAAGGAG